MHDVKKYDLLLSCPGDAYGECFSAVKAAVDKFNNDPQFSSFVVISLIHWSKNSYPQSGGSAQELLNNQIVNDSDFAIAIFWTRFGTPTDEYNSGTEEEIDLLMKKKRQVFLYFLDKPVPPSITDSPEYFDNRRRILNFKNKYKGIYWTVNSEKELEEMFFKHLKLHFSTEKVSTTNTDNAQKWYRSDTGKAIKPSELITYGNVTAQIDGNITRTEVIKPDGKEIYAEFDMSSNSVSHIKAEGFPQEYKLNIPNRLIIDKKAGTTTIDGIVYYAEIYTLKFGGQVQAIYDTKEHKLQDLQAKAPAGMTVFIDTTSNKICIIKEDSV